MHGGQEFDFLVNNQGDVILCLHKWGEHGHPTMQNSNVTPGNGLILYLRTENIEGIRENLIRMDYAVEEEIQLNRNSSKREFSLIDPNGYYLTISEYHKFEG